MIKIVSRYALYIIHLEYMNIRVNITYREAEEEKKHAGILSLYCKILCSNSRMYSDPPSSDYYILNILCTMLQLVHTNKYIQKSQTSLPLFFFFSPPPSFFRPRETKVRNYAGGLLFQFRGPGD